MVVPCGYEPLDERSLRVLVERAGLVVDQSDLEQLLPLANELLEMSSAVSAFIGCRPELTPIYVVNAIQARG